jgi:SagB-type dehydrogenase family enzyme
VLGDDVGSLLRHSLGLSAWKQFRDSGPSTGSGRRESVERRWSLRVNPSSGNLHPTEAYLVAAGSDSSAVYHYAPDRHALEQRCTFSRGAWIDAMAGDEDAWLVALTSIHWREAWKYGERAFRYCQHDLGHAIAALAIAAPLVGRHVRLLPDWCAGDIARLTGIDRDSDYVDAEREEAQCVLLVGRTAAVGHPASAVAGREALVDAVAAGNWSGRANQLSEDHVQWTFIDEIAEATRDPGHSGSSVPLALPAQPGPPVPPLYAPALLLQRRSAVSLDGRGSIDGTAFFAMLSRAMPGEGAPWDALWWDPRIHLLLFVHRVSNVDPGAYVLIRNPSALARLRAACGRDFLWEPAHPSLPLFLLARSDCRALAQRVSCDQAIAGDGFFSLGMLAEFDASLEAFGPSFYRQLFWESGVVGQVLYLEAEAAGARGTGIGCFYDDPVHDCLALRGHAFQSLYHFTIGTPVEDTRLTTEPGYPWG